MNESITSTNKIPTNPFENNELIEPSKEVINSNIEEPKVKRITGFIPDYSTYNDNKVNIPGELVVKEVTHKVKRKVNPKVTVGFIVMLIGIAGFILLSIFPLDTIVPSLILNIFKCVCVIFSMLGCFSISNTMKSITEGTEDSVIEEDKEVINYSPFKAKTPDQLTNKRLEDTSKK